MGSAWICSKCGFVFLWVRHGKETKPRECPRCGSTEIDKMEG